jgi:beta-N-acetylhexosaminidase
MIREVIRGWIGFDGLLMSDDVSMGALSGSVGARTRAAVGAGCDIVLHCNGTLPERYHVADAVPALQDAAGRRAAAALALRSTPAALDVAAARSEFRRLLATVEVEVS